MAACSKMSEREKERNAHYCELRHSRVSRSSPRMPSQTEMIIFAVFGRLSTNQNLKTSRQVAGAETSRGLTSFVADLSKICSSRQYTILSHSVSRYRTKTLLQIQVQHTTFISETIAPHAQMPPCRRSQHNIGFFCNVMESVNVFWTLLAALGRGTPLFSKLLVAAQHDGKGRSLIFTEFSPL